MIADPEKISDAQRVAALFEAAVQEAVADRDTLHDPGEGIAIQLFTSGTTAAPKAAILSHANLVSYILGTVEFASAGEDEAALVSVPPYHIAGIAAVLSSLYAGRRIVMLPAFAPDAWLKLVEAEAVTGAFVVPTMLSRIIHAMDKGVRGDISSLKAIAYGGGKMPLELIRHALELFPETGFTNAYGLTETSSTVALLGPEEHRAAQRSSDPKVQARLASVGIPLPSIELEIRDEDGYLFLSGRADDVIVRGGENISPGEIEDAVLSHPAIADAVAVPSAEWGEAVGLALVVRGGFDQPGEDELNELIRARLRSSRVPETIRFVAALPYNEMGKLLRREVKGMLE